MKIFILLTLFGSCALALPKCSLPPAPRIGVMGPPERIVVPGDVAADNVPRIIGGEDAKPGEFPHQISLQVRPASGAKYHNCGGSILDETHIICAAHCVRGQNVDNLEVVAGAHNMTNDAEPEQQRVKVASFVHHPDYDAWYLSHDASIIKLASPLVFNDRVKPIRIAPKGQTHSGRCLNTGWGNSRPGGGTPAIIPEFLQVVTLDIIEKERCKQMYSNINPVDDTMVCAGDDAGGKGSCNGDSGGPLVCKDKDGVDYLAGIVSWSMQPCAQKQYPTVFGDVAYFSDWLKEQTQN